MSTHAPHTRSVTPWKATPAAGRVPTPAPQVVAAAPLLAALWRALGDEPAPCHGHADLWTSDDPDDVLVAQEGCAECPARVACLAYGCAIAATCGVFGGHDRTVRDERRPITTTKLEQSA